MKKAGVTGANGFIGSRLCQYLADNGYEVICLVRKNSDISLLNASLNICYVDYQNLNSLKSSINGCDLIIHAAALTRAKNWQQIKKVNVDLTYDLVNLTNDTDSIKQFIFLSSQAAAGPSLSAYGKSEDDECNPVSLYGKSKLEAEQKIKSYCMKNWTIIRPVSVFGPGEKDFYQYYRLVSRGFSPLIGIVDRYINLIHVDDLCKMIDLSIGNSSANNECFFASSSEVISMAVFAHMLAQIMQKKLIEFHLPLPLLFLGAVISELFCPPKKFPPLLNRQKYKEITQRYWIVNNRKAYELLNFISDSTLTKQLVNTIQWYKVRNLL